MAEEPNRSSTTIKRERRKKQRDLIKDLSRVAIVVAIFIGCGFLIALADVKNVDDVMSLGQRIRERLHPDDSITAQFTSYLIYCGVSAGLIALGLPRWITAVVAGSIYGAFLGIVLASIAAQIGATGTYLIGSSLLRSTVTRRLGQRFPKIHDKFVENAFVYTLQLRLFPASPAVVTSLLCGACRVSYRDYQLANLIGFLPQTIILALIGSGTTKQENWQVIVGIVLFVLFTVGNWYVRRILTKHAEMKKLLQEDDADVETPAER